MDELLVTQMGLMLTETRSTRRALEGIERAVTRSMPIGLLVGAGSAIAALGAPPLFEGALKVYVVNIGDMVAEGGGLLDVIGGVFGAAGRFLGGVVGGAVGGTAAGVLLMFAIKDIAKIAESADSIMRQLVTPGGDKPGEPTLRQNLEDLRGILLDVKGLFVTAGEGPGGASPGLAESLNPVVQGLVAATRIVNGLVVLIPFAIGAMAWLFEHLRELMSGIAEAVAFAFRMALLLRAAVIAVVVDTVTLAVKLADEVLPILRDGLVTILKAVFELIEAIARAFMEVLVAIGPKLSEFADGLMKFLRDGVGAFLTAIGDSVVMRFLIAFANMLPGLVSLLAAAGGVTLNPAQAADLAAARAAAGSLPSGSGPVSTAPIAFPNLGRIIDKTVQDDVVKAITDGAAAATKATNTVFDSARDTAVQAGKKINDTLAGANAGLDARLKDRVAEANKAAAGTDEALRSFRTTQPTTGPFTEIATAYEAWFTGGGLNRVMNDFGKTFQSEVSAQGAAGPLGQAAAAQVPPTGTADVVVDIDKVIIDLVPPHAGPTPAVVVTPPVPAPHDAKREQDARGASTVPRSQICPTPVPVGRP
jgi:hypothetical protein